MLTILILMVTQVVPAASNGMTTFYVSPDGNDTWSGRLPSPNAKATNGPFATVGRAVEAARITRADVGGVPVAIALRGGTYYLAEPIVLTAGDSGTPDAPLIFTAYEQEKPLLSGGRPITGWKKNEEAIWTASISPGWHFRTLRVNEQWAIRARYPNFDPKEPIKGGWAFARSIVIPAEVGAFNVNVGNIHNPGDRLEWEIEVPAEGAYTVWVRYGHKMKDYNRVNMDDQTVLGVVDGEEVWLGDLPDTGGWASTRWAKSATLNLPKGRQTLYWENKKGGGLSLDGFCLTNDLEWDPAQSVHINGQTGEHTVDSVAEGKHVLVIQAETCSKAIGPEITIGLPQPRGSTDRVVMEPEEFPPWIDWTGAELHIFPAWGWVNTITPITGTVPEDHLLKLNCPQEVRPGNRFFIAGTREALDVPGEWHVDPASGTVSLWPNGFDPNEAEIVAPVHESLFVLSGDSASETFVEHVQFRGLTFMDTTYELNHTYSPDNAVISFSAAANCSIEECIFTLNAGYALKLSDKSHYNRFVKNSVHEVGQGGVMLVGDASRQAHHNLVAANTMSDLGKIYAHVAGVYVTTGSDNRIVHNRIHRVPRYGISLKSYDPEGYSHRNVVEFNEIIDSNLETNDTGAIETLGRDQRNTGNIIRYNLIRNVVGLKTSPEGEILSPYFTWGIYLDDYSSGTTVFGNIVDGTVIGGFCIHGGKDNRIENNIFLNASKQQLRLQPRDDFMQGNTFLHNIVAYHEADSVLWYSYDRTWRPDRLSLCDNNVYWCWSNFDIATTDKAITPEGSYQDWRAIGFDQHSIVAEPMFVSPELEHFALESNSPAFRVGYEPIPEDRIGPEGYGE